MAKKPAKPRRGPIDSQSTEDERHALSWTFLSNHSHVIICLARDPEIRMRDVAELVGITERAAIRIVTDLEGAGYIKRAYRSTQSIYNRGRQAPTAPLGGSPFD